MPIAHATRGKGATIKNDWKRLFDDAPKDELTSFLRMVLKQDKHWRKEFCARFATRTPDEVASEVIERIDDYFRRNEYDEYVCLDWRVLEKIGRHIQGVVRDAARPLLDKGDWHGAFAVGLAGLSVVRSHQVDDESYSLTNDACTAAIEVWEKIKERGGDEGASIVADGCHAFMDEAFTENGDEDEWGNYAEVVLFEQGIRIKDFFQEAFASDSREAESLLASLRCELESSTESDQWYAQKLVADKVSCALACLDTLGATMEERVELCEPFLATNDAVRLVCANMLADAGETDPAVNLALGVYHHKGLERSRAAELLLSLLPSYSHEQKRVAILTELVCDPKINEPLPFWRLLRQSVPDADWEATSTQLLARLIKRGNAYLALCAEEGRLAELMDGVERSGNIGALEYYLTILKGAYPQRVIALYERLLLEQLDHAYTRDQYREELTALKRIQEIEGGDEACAYLDAEIRKRWPRRRALREELDRIEL